MATGLNTRPLKEPEFAKANLNSDSPGGTRSLESARQATFRLPFHSLTGRQHARSRIGPKYGLEGPRPSRSPVRKVQSRTRRPADTFQGSAGLLCLIGLALLTSGLTAANTTGADDFSGPVDTEKWGTDLTIGFATFSHGSGLLQYATGFLVPFTSDWVARPWKLNRLPYASDWSVKVNVMVPAGIDGMLDAETKSLSAGILVTPDLPGSLLNMASFSLRRRSGSGGIDSFWTTDIVDLGFPREPQSVAAGAENATVTVRWETASRTLTAEGSGDGIPLEVFSILRFGADEDLAWAVQEDGAFTIALFASAPGLTLTIADGLALDNFEFVCEATDPGTSDPFTELPDLGGGWRDSPWFGFVNTSFFPWVFHLQHQWLFHVFRPAEQEIFFYDLTSAAWWFTSEQLYPNLFSFNRGRWIFYFVETATPREFVDLESGEFFSLP